MVYNTPSLMTRSSLPIFQKSRIHTSNQGAPDTNHYKMEAQNYGRLTRQPYKFLYGTFLIITLPLQILYIFLYRKPKHLRQHPRWTYLQATGLDIFLIWWKYTSTVRYVTPKSLKPGFLKDRFIVISPPSTTPSIYRGIVDDAVVRPSTIGAAWYPAVYTPGSTGGLAQQITIHFHGGAYVLGGCRPLESGWGPEVLAKHMKGPVLQVQYRLSVEKDAHFPAALQDGLTAYHYVLNHLKVGPENVILSGESAGANIVLAMIRYLSEDGKGLLPSPRAGLLWSPWVDLTLNHLTLDSHPRANTDYMKGSLLEWGASSFTPPGGDRSHPYISFLGHEFKSQVPLFIQTGTAEVLYDDHVKFASSMKAMGTEVELMEIKDAPHDTFGAGIILGWVKEAEAAVSNAVAFVGKAQYGTPKDKRI
ncbi:alpha/beta-Hydrolase [Glarea lozoyensis ATCC 20868]|uniref:Alpha/beta-Hydrolase n=1 Tax=Glarea lozoyensis (strain ATCC 20868 / MF5171) TaxID=1116229 RepID=S3EAN8_GLAL2|nr:alpha/beta-Hydrolase [Glarea lozoyensis ATCC 20868]EPE35383.1 alpha/beta-Hydrolase [Glarea lozoyensis ATCC 20868]